MTKCMYFRYMDCKVIDKLTEELGREEALKVLPSYCANCDRRKNKARASGFKEE